VHKVAAMAIQNKDLPRFSIVPKNANIKRLFIGLATLWLVLAVLFLWSLWFYSDSHSAKLAKHLSVSNKSLSETREQLDLVKQQLANSQRSEFISRNANIQIQNSLADKDEQIAGLKADLNFYELLVGSSGRRHGLSVHTAEFEAQSDGAWQYTITLTQNINRGGMTSGQMSFNVDGVMDGKLKTLNWSELTQNPQSTGQKFAFRYFQQLKGNAMLPKGFKPQQVKVTVKGVFGSNDAQFDWLVKKQSSPINQD
jgi:hypothetical protein